MKELTKQWALNEDEVHGRGRKPGPEPPKPDRARARVWPTLRF